MARGERRNRDGRAGGRRGKVDRRQLSTSIAGVGDGVTGKCPVEREVLINEF